MSAKDLKLKEYKGTIYSFLRFTFSKHFVLKWAHVNSILHLENSANIQIQIRSFMFRPIWSDFSDTLQVIDILKLWKTSPHLYRN